ncbi:hypothetical protein QAD02_023297 [Eretmocerus hayati]|uniref:Uncharacterized protein n=1 Tax=Eretmocerus hayati TaxID=131215 RepID=A0ACC2PVI2_9HYME|nr:hypothetical protein QAD02_023297 [Eretmocerus hayati]
MLRILLRIHHTINPSLMEISTLSHPENLNVLRISRYHYDTNDVYLGDDADVVEFLTSDLNPVKRYRRSPGVQPPTDPDPLIDARQPNNSTNVSYSTSEQQGQPSIGPSGRPIGSSAPVNNGAKVSNTQDPTSSYGPGKSVIVSTPISAPSADKAKAAAAAGLNVTAGASFDAKDKPKIKVWANRTMWDNATESRNVDATSDSVVDELAIDKYPGDLTNKTLHDHNITKNETDTHQYYNSTFSTDESVGKNYWLDLDSHPDTQINPLLSNSHRRAATIKLKFDFPFYGHKVRNITIATGGFLYTGEYVHSWLAATQYIAPLMANFDTTLSDKSFVRYADNGTAFTVEWKNVHLKDKVDAGPFTFQVTLLQNGDIVFVYKSIPVLVESIEDKEHPVKIGLSDAYMMDRIIILTRRKTIYEYHRVNFRGTDIKNWTAIYLKALPTCLQMENCNDCLTKVSDFDCKWCSALQQCSTGTFRFRQEWLLKNCDKDNVREVQKCPARSLIPGTSSGSNSGSGPGSGSSTTREYREHVDSRVDNSRHDDEPMAKHLPGKQAASIGHPGSVDSAQDNMNMGVSGVVGVLFVITLVAGLVAWAGYAYRNPHSTSGQMLIRYRPSQWSWRRGEARYTAATIHM